MTKLSVIIITFNEEMNIKRAIDSVNFADEVIVVDSFSTDKTEEIAKRCGAKVFRQKFLGFGAQKEYATSLCQNDWIFSLDADEEVTKGLELEIINIVKNDFSFVYQVNRKTFFRAKWIKYGGWYPDFVNRLYKKKSANWTLSKVHEVLLVNKNTSLATLKNELNHYSFPSFLSQIETNIKYAKLGSEILITKNKDCSLAMMILKPIGKFIECYFLKRGFLDGKEGFIIAINASYSMFMKYTFANLKE